MINIEQDHINPYLIASNLGRRRDMMGSVIRRLEKHLKSNAVANYPQATESLSVLKSELNFVEKLISAFQPRIPIDMSSKN